MRTTIVTVLLGLLFAPLALPQGLDWWTGSAGWGPGSQYCRMWDKHTIEELSGEIVSVEPFRPAEGMDYGIHLTLKTDRETISIHLGPEWYIAHQDIRLEPKDRISIKGSRMTQSFFGEKPFIVANWVKKGEDVLRLRDDYGYPVWQGWRRGQL